ncbi:hypothetical protein FOA52_003348 [Chlamydomonas sp. UWO 241]|nr:hypothetical protein FOA52_003348 [Chlamydomonas sp. UWO 241]
MASPALPKLPGYTVNLPQSIGDKAFYKAQTLNFSKGYQQEAPTPVVRDVSDTLAAMAATAGSGHGSPKLTGTFSGTSSPSKMPQWVENDRKVLRFYGYFKETVPESRMENHRVRKIILYYYLEDDSMHMAEPKTDNSGIPQGVLIKRHKVTKEDGTFFTPVDFSVGAELSIYGRAYFLTDVDKFTREFYDAQGIEQGSPIGHPDDPVDTYKATFGLNRGTGKSVPTQGGGGYANDTASRLDDFKQFMEARLGKATHLLNGGGGYAQFLENNKKVLRFWCVHDDRQNMYGDRRPYVLNYYLEDDSIELLEVRDQNSGRDPFPVFMRRAPLPKSVLSSGTQTVGLAVNRAQCYRPEDLRLGQYISVLNRDMLLYDCDRFTKHWYATNLGYDDAELEKVDVQEPVPAMSKPALAPYNGYGTLEDSLQNCVSLIPKPPRRDMHKLMNKDKIILRFNLKIVETETHKHSAIDLGRKFILSYFMMDDTVQLFEPPVRNTGIGGGKFLERSKVYKPKSEEIYTYLDLYVGGKIEIHNRTFEMSEADEYTFTYMENNKHVFIMADHEVLLKSLRAQISGREELVRTAFIAMDKNGSGLLSGSELEAALTAAGLKFTRHQAQSLKRRLDKDKSGTISIDEFLHALGLVQ